MPLIRAVVVALLVGTMPASGPISLSQCQTEFGGANPVSMSEYYEGAATGYVTSSATQPNNIPTTGAISLWNFYGSAKTPPGPAPTITPATLNCMCIALGSCSCTTTAATCSGGTGAIAWSVVGDHTANSPSGTSTTFTASGATGGSSSLDTCNQASSQVTCSAGGVASTNILYVSSDLCRT